MGVRKTDFVLIGFDIGNTHYEENNDYEKYDIHNKKPGDMVYLCDNYSEIYFVVGQIIQMDKYRINGLDPVDFADLEIIHSEDKLKVNAFIKEKFHIDVASKIMVFTHWH
jgi:hypothetical protein